MKFLKKVLALWNKIGSWKWATLAIGLFYLSLKSHSFGILAAGILVGLTFKPFLKRTER